MSKQETNKMRTEQEGQVNLEDLPVGDARQDEVKGGTGVAAPDGRIYTITITATNSY